MLLTPFQNEDNEISSKTSEYNVVDTGSHLALRK